MRLEAGEPLARLLLRVLRLAHGELGVGELRAERLDLRGVHLRAVELLLGAGELDSKLGGLRAGAVERLLRHDELGLVLLCLGPRLGELRGAGARLGQLGGELLVRLLLRAAAWPRARPSPP